MLLLLLALLVPNFFGQGSVEDRVQYKVETEEQEIVETEPKVESEIDPSPVTPTVNNPAQTAKSDDYVFPSAEKRFKTFLKNTAGPRTLIGTTIGTTFQQLGDEPPEWKKDAGGFTRRFASNFGENAIEQATKYAISEAFQQDPRYEKCECTKTSKRVLHALKSGFTARNRSGNTVFSPAKVVAPYVGSVTAVKAWYPERYSVQDGLRKGTYGLAFNVGFNLVREFIFRK